MGLIRMSGLVIRIVSVISSGVLFVLIKKYINFLIARIISTEKIDKILIFKTWATLNKTDVIWKTDLPDNLKRSLFCSTVEKV